MKQAALKIFMVFMALVLAGCASSLSGEVYTREQARTSHTISYGKVIGVKHVLIEGTKGTIGSIMGGAAGAALGNTIGSGTGRTLASVAGGILGALAGNAIEKEVTKKDGLEITVKLDDGQMIAVVQEADIPFSVGDRVRVLYGYDGTTRVRR